MEDKDKCKLLDDKTDEINTIAMEILKSMKEANNRMYKLAISLLVAWFSTIGIFVWYLNQYDYTSTTTTETFTQDGQGLNVIGDSNNIDKVVDDGADINTNGKN